MTSQFITRRRFISFIYALLCLCSLTMSARAAWRTAGNVLAVARQADGATLTLSSGARVSITFVSPDVVRVRLSPTGKFERDFSYALEEKERKHPLTSLRETGREAFELTTQLAGAKVIIKRRPFLIEIYDAQGQLIVADDPANPVAFDPESGEIEASKRRDALEFYYGFGEKALPESRQEQSIVNWNTDTYSYPPGLDPIYQSIPFFIALRQGRAYGLFFDNTYRTHFDMGHTAPERYTFGAAGGELNYYVFTGGSVHSPKNIVRDYTELTGRTSLPPMWALGYQQSRWGYYPEARVRELARRFRADKIPCDVLYLDIDYMNGYRVFTWDQTRFPDPQKLTGDLRAAGFRVVNIVDPGVKVDENYSVYTDGRARGLYCKTPAGAEFHANVWPGSCAFPDFTNPKAREWFGAQYKKLLDDGVSGFWNDMNEPATFLPDNLQEPSVFHHPGKTFPLDIRHDGDGLTGDHARYHNVYGMQMARSTFEGLKNLRPDARPLVITRAGYAGVQRFSSVWTGDNVPTWEHLQLSIAMLTNMGVSGIPFVGADVGGFAGNASAELYTRWLQAASLTPFYRTHITSGMQDREPWSFGEDYEKINRASIELRYQLLPYLYTRFHEHEESGAPVMRPLWFNYPADYNTYSTPLPSGEYMIGDDLLVAPVLEAGATKRSVYFPKGDAWLDWWTGARYEGGKSAEMSAPLDRLPLFVRVGASLPVQPILQNTGEMARAPISFTIASGGDGVSHFYEDAGDGNDYRRGASRIVTITQNAGAISFSNDGSYRTPRQINEVDLLGVNAKPREVRIDGRAAKRVDYDKEEKRLRVPLPEQMVKEIVIVP